MWLVIKYKKKQLNLLKEEFKKKLGITPDEFCPRIQIQKIIKNKIQLTSNDILGDYILINHKKFEDKKILQVIKNFVGLKLLIDNSRYYQSEINEFIKNCKKNTDKSGFITQGFFNFENFKKGIFVSGPFANMIFQIIDNQKNYLKVLVNNISTTIPKNKDCLYRPI
jgi:hypothetical protein